MDGGEKTFEGRIRKRFREKKLAPEQEWFQNYFVVRGDAGDEMSHYYACGGRIRFASIKDETGETYQSKLLIFTSQENAETFAESQDKITIDRSD